MKAILVLDMPDNCERCLFRIINIPLTDFDCYAFKATRRIENSDIKQPWCPLRPLPQKREPNEEWLNEYHRDEFADGWNACIKAIVGETE